MITVLLIEQLSLNGLIEQLEKMNKSTQLKRLILMRHAKSSWKDGLSDHQRTLNKRGRKNAPLIANELIQLDWEPDLVLSSDASRTRETWELMSEQFTQSPKTIFLNSLYLAGIRDIRDAIAQADDQYSTIMLIGHNPGWEQAASFLTGQDIWFTTANAALLSITHESWEKALHNQGTWELHQVVRPKEID
ncbi:MAG: histidine phosphatase [Blastopirellula sp.]|nr:MAG: histidine phosphatase [Blastopirellula sp.]